jgi:hypothetical protein
MRALFPVAALPAVAGLIRARMRRTLSPETARQRGTGTACRPTSAASDRTGWASEGMGAGKKRRAADGPLSALAHAS